MPKELPEHRDILGRVLAVGDHVAFPDSNHMYLGKVDKLNTKMIRVSYPNWRGTLNKYASDTVKLDGPDLVMYLLKK